MLIAHVTIQTAAKDLENALDVLLSAAPGVRAMQGCQAYQPFINPQTDGQIMLVQEWETTDSFQNYLASSSFNNSGAKLAPLMTAAPISKRFQADPIAD
ncbi:MAG: antibiotic biosynthesis monooxygenase [Pseudomonadota bacterium]|nr:antibiotic biosynthesis monooxygenase [Pseudomonadota bacterium]